MSVRERSRLCDLAFWAGVALVIIGPGPDGWSFASAGLGALLAGAGVLCSRGEIVSEWTRVVRDGLKPLVLRRWVVGLALCAGGTLLLARALVG